MKVLNYLLGYENLKIYQDTELFHFSLDSVLLSHFVTINKKISHVLDIGSGNAVIPILLSTRTNAQITGVEIQEYSYQLGVESVVYNHLQAQIQLVNQDIKDFAQKMESDIYDVITCNPPFFKIGEFSHFNDSEAKKIARHEVCLNLEDVMHISRKLLKNGGVLALVHRPERLMDILHLMQKYNIEPKKIQFIYPKKNREANIVLIEGSKNGNSGLKILPPLYSHQENGDYTEEITHYFIRGEKDVTEKL